MTLAEIKKIFVEKKGIFGEPYKSAILGDKEITIDNITGEFRICLCTPYDEKLEKKRFCRGAGEVIKEWYFGSEDQAVAFLVKENVI